MKLLLSPHNDDETLFSAYVALRERPKVITVLDGGPGQKNRVDPPVRVAESAAAMEILGCDFEHLGFPVDIRDWDPVAERLAGESDVERVWAPVPEPGGHRHHNRLTQVALQVFGPERVSFYSTYRCEEPSGWPIRTDHGYPIETEDDWPSLKRAALSCYVSQIESTGTRMHFERSLGEFEMPELRLNLGGGINAIPGYVNLDISTGWTFEQGLGDYPDDSVSAITESHALMYVALEEWPYVFGEIARVLRPGGTVRITQDAIGAEGSSRPTIRPGAAVATTPELVLEHLGRAGIDADLLEPDETGFSDRSLIQQNYGQPPDVFHVEGRKALK